MMRAMVLGLFVVLVGCGSEDGGGMTLPSPAEQEAARAKCQTLKLTVCARILECGVQATQKECLDALGASIDCGKVVAVSASFPTCLQELPTFSCSVLAGGANLPASCNGSLLVPE